MLAVVLSPPEKMFPYSNRFIDEDKSTVVAV